MECNPESSQLFVYIVCHSVKNRQKHQKPRPQVEGAERDRTRCDADTGILLKPVYDMMTLLLRIILIWDKSNTSLLY